MTSATSATRSTDAGVRALGASRRRDLTGFSLVELLVVMGIIVLLLGILVPSVQRARRAAFRTRQAADLQVIATGLEAYKADFGDYPRPDSAVPNSGAMILCKAMIGPGDAAPTSNPNPPQFVSGQNYATGEVVCDQATPDTPGAKTYVAVMGSPTTPPALTSTTYWAEVWWFDGADGPGHRKRGTQGQVYGPYIRPDFFAVDGMYLRDRAGMVILYLVANRTPPNIHAVGGYAALGSSALYDLRQAKAIFDTTDNTARAEMRAALGDYNDNGAIDPDETPATSDPYILWTAGDDKNFGPGSIVSGNGTTPISAANAKKNRTSINTDYDDLTSFNGQ